MKKQSTNVFTLGHSPDPDDAFMFYAIAEHKIDLRGYRFAHRLEDIQTLNERARRGELHVSAISIHAYAYLTDKYALLPCGASMGNGYGPIVVRRRSTPNIQRTTPNTDSTSEAAAQTFLNGKKIAVPGEMTSAFLALRLFLGKFDYRVVRFDKIFDAVKSGRAEAGLIIHEGQLTYAQSGLHKVLDLGQWWREETGLPLPLGGNAIRRSLGEDTMRIVTQALRDSIQHGLDHRDEALTYAMQFARDLDQVLANKFVGMYVNERTLDYGPDGREAIRRLLDMGHKAGIIAHAAKVDFV